MSSSRDPRTLNSLTGPAALLLSVSACACLIEIEDPEIEYAVGGIVEGLWQWEPRPGQPESARVVLELRYHDRKTGEDIVERYAPGDQSSIFENGTRSAMKRRLPPNTEYEITLLESPRGHTCRLENPGPQILTADANHHVKCIGPASDVTLSRSSHETFDPSEDSQIFWVPSTTAENVEITINGRDLTHAQIGDVPVEVGQPARIALPEDATTVKLQLQAHDDQSRTLSKTYSLTFRRRLRLMHLIPGKPWNIDDDPDRIWPQAP